MHCAYAIPGARLDDHATEGLSFRHGLALAVELLKVSEGISFPVARLVETAQERDVRLSAWTEPVPANLSEYGSGWTGQAIEYADETSAQGSDYVEIASQLGIGSEDALISSVWYPASKCVRQLT